MTSRTSRADHEAALARRLTLLGEELNGVRGGPRDPFEAEARASVPLPPGPSLATIPVPGRHASRRPGRLPDLVPATLRGRVALGPGPLAVVAVLVALGLGVTTWWVVRADTRTVAPLAPLAPVSTTDPASPLATSTTPGASSGGEAPGGGEEKGTVTVDVAGKVRRPGIVVLETGARVVDALREAGGTRPGVDLTGLNLARLLVDGEQVVVGVTTPMVGLPAPLASPGGPTGALVDLNTADQVALESLPEVGPVTAQAILTWRDQNGGFTAIAELLEVDGIGDATLAAVTPFVTV